MKKLVITFLSLIILQGCGDITHGQIQVAYELCGEKLGLYKVDVANYGVKVYCNHAKTREYDISEYIIKTKYEEVINNH